MPKVSIVSVTYNHEKFIREALESFVMQKTDFDFEVIIGDDCSTDNTQAIIREFEQKYPSIIKPIYRDKNIGAGPNFYDVLSRAKGKYIALCEGDDYWTDPLKLQKQVDFLEANPDYSICFHRIKVLKDNQLIDDYINRNVPETTTIEEFCNGNYIHTTSTVFKHNFKDVKILPEILLKAPWGDYTLHMFNAQYGKIKKLDEVMAVYRVHGNSMHSTSLTSKILEGDIATFDCLISYFSNNTSISKKLQSTRFTFIRAFGEILFDSTIFYDTGKGFNSTEQILIRNLSRNNNLDNIEIFFKFPHHLKSVKSVRWDPIKKPCNVKIKDITYVDENEIMHYYDLWSITSNGVILNNNPSEIDFFTPDPQVFLNISGSLKSIKINSIISPKSYSDLCSLLNPLKNIQLFYDTGEGINEKNSIIKNVKSGTELQEFEFDLLGNRQQAIGNSEQLSSFKSQVSNSLASKIQNPKSKIINIRLDPLNDSVVFTIEEIFIVTESGDKISLIDKIQANVATYHENHYFFETADPQIYFSSIPENTQKLFVKLKYNHFGKDALQCTAQQLTTANQQLTTANQQLTTELSAIHKSKDWELLQILYRIASVVIPEGSLRRKLTAKIFYILNKPKKLNL